MNRKENFIKELFKLMPDDEVTYEDAIRFVRLWKQSNEHIKLIRSILLNEQELISSDQTEGLFGKPLDFIDRVVEDSSEDYDSEEASSEEPALAIVIDKFPPALSTPQRRADFFFMSRDEFCDKHLSLIHI